ncbi:hypothetical protein [Hymenobacter lucidus]|uniref:NTF2 fold domain-containing protein n=1 Tax=Hymenobacter lucidus TaxID=2880930 RepID=A0ABS8APY6_9BACT|nr:hypothetical protein [Hymenobacter lucidus]MCB2408262.1 hypothetical protein [Hymenobacter lucidus]
MKYGFFFLASLLIACTSSPEKKAEAAVAEYVSNRLVDPHYYRPGPFETKPYTRQDSVAYLAGIAQLNADSTTAKPGTAPKVAQGGAQIGTFVRHAYQEHTKAGDIRRDSGEFVVYPSGEVVQLIPSYRLGPR